MIASGVRPNRALLNMSRAMLSGTKISMSTAIGHMNRNTDMCGVHDMCRTTGYRIAMAAGRGFHLGVGPGWIIRVGDSLPSTMVAGRMFAIAGAGYPALATIDLFTPPHSSAGLADLTWE